MTVSVALIVGDVLDDGVWVIDCENEIDDDFLGEEDLVWDGVLGTDSD